MPHIVRSSERAAKRRCRRAWDLGYRQNWQPNVMGQALEFGTAVHTGFQAIYAPELWDETTPSQKLLRAQTAFVANCEAQSEAYLETIGTRRTNWDGRDDYEARKELGKKMLEYYVLEVHPTADVGLRPVKVEIKFQVPLVDENGEQLRCNNSPHCGQVHEDNALAVHEGRIDALMEDLVNGGYLALDWKSVGGDKAIDGIEKNTGRFSDPTLVWIHDQLNTYSWALRCVLKIDVRGFILAEIRKDYPRIPAPLRRPAGRYSRDKNLATTYKVYSEYVEKSDPDGYHDGYYDQYIEWLTSKDAPRFHERFRVTKTDAELREVGKNLIREVREMLKPDVEVYPEAGLFSCKRCGFRAPCEMMMRGMDYAYTLNSGYHKESRV